MSGENGHPAPPAEGAPPAVEEKDEAAKSEAVEAPKEAAAIDAEAAAAESEAEPAPAPASGSAEPKEEADKAAEAFAEKPAEPAEERPDVEMANDAAPAEPAPEAAEAAEAAETAEAEQAEQGGDGADKSKSKRKSTGGGDLKGKKLNKKASKPRMLHLDAQPGDHFFVKLKGFPQWPVIICDEDMLPASLLKTRPVTAKRADGSYREDYADGGKKVADRTFPVMYLHTNEFGWVPNTELIELDPSTVLDVKLDKMRKPLQAAYQLAAENHPLSYYKEVLQNYQEELIEQEKAKAAKAASSKKKGKAAADEDEDVEMEDAPDVETPAGKKAKKRKAEDSAETPQRSGSVKKPKIKLTTSATPKAANGATSTPKSSKAAESAKGKAKKADEKTADKEAAAPKEPELSAEDRHARKEKEVLFLRHKLQKGLLTRDQEPKEEEMKLMSDYITKLEGFPDLEVSIIRATKINKVLKAILKLENIPKEDEFKFKPRSQVLLDKWNKLLAVEGGTPTAAAPAAAEANGALKGSASVNGLKEKSEAADAGKAKGEEAKEAAKEEARDKAEEPAKPEGASEDAKKPAVEESTAAEPVETSA